MKKSFTFRVSGYYPNVKLHITQVLWKRLGKALLWSLVFVILTYIVIHLNGVNVFSSSISFFCLLLAGFGILVSYGSAALNTFWIGADVLTWREIRPSSYRKRSLPIWAVRDFGGAMYSHGGPALRLDVDGEWYLLAELVQERDADDLLQALKEHGIAFPSTLSEREVHTDTVTPRITTLE